MQGFFKNVFSMFFNLLLFYMSKIILFYTTKTSINEYVKINMNIESPKITTCKPHTPTQHISKDNRSR